MCVYSAICWPKRGYRNLVVEVQKSVCLFRLTFDCICPKYPEQEKRLSQPWGEPRDPHTVYSSVSVSVFCSRHDTYLKVPRSVMEKDCHSTLALCKNSSGYSLKAELSLSSWGHSFLSDIIQSLGPDGVGGREEKFCQAFSRELSFHGRLSDSLNVLLRRLF